MKGFTIEQIQAILGYIAMAAHDMNMPANDTRDLMYQLTDDSFVRATPDEAIEWLAEWHKIYD